MIEVDVLLLVGEGTGFGCLGGATVSCASNRGKACWGILARTRVGLAAYFDDCCL